MDATIKYKKALDKFTEKYKKDSNVLGILLTGSFIHSKPDKNSDLDIYIVIEKSKTRERGNTWIEGVEIEYFINPVNQVLEYFKEETQEKSPNTAHMFVNSKIIYEKGNKLRKLISKAKEVLKIPPEKPSKSDIENMKYFIDDLEKDLEDMKIKKNEFAYRLVANSILKKILDDFYRIKQIYKEKSKRLFEQMNTIDKKFAILYKKAMISYKYEDIIKLIRYMEKIIGGKRSKEWKLKGKLTIK